MGLKIVISPALLSFCFGVDLPKCLVNNSLFWLVLEGWLLLREDSSEGRIQAALSQQPPGETAANSIVVLGWSPAVWTGITANMNLTHSCNSSGEKSLLLTFSSRSLFLGWFSGSGPWPTVCSNTSPGFVSRNSSSPVFLMLIFQKMSQCWAMGLKRVRKAIRKDDVNNVADPPPEFHGYVVSPWLHGLPYCTVSKLMKTLCSPSSTLPAAYHTNHPKNIS